MGLFSGSAVVDLNNTSGQHCQNPPMVAIFTYHNMDGEKSAAKIFKLKD
jgi:fructan beta-fructosidase